MQFTLAPDIGEKLKTIIHKLNLTHLQPNQIVAFRSYGSRARARARIWSFPRIWQMALQEKPHYCIEVLSEKFDCLSEKDQTKILIHELMHIPQNFSGALLPHRGRGRVVINSRSVNKLFKKYQKK